MAKKISGAEYPLAKIFSSEFDYIIPSYQRPYAWSFDQTSELFDDLYDFFLKEKEDSYFLGSIVLIKSDDAPYAEVIDGQQRLTTLTILLAAITHQFDGDLRADFENYIREPGRASQGLKPKPRLALRERDRDFFANYVQTLQFEKLLALESAQLNNESQKNIQNNSKLLLNRLEKHFDSDTDKLCDFGAFLVQRCFLVAVSTPSQQSAFRVFSVMNSRGLDLQPTDIIKADIIGEIATKEEQEEYNERWEDMEVELGRSGFNDLFTYVRMIYAKQKAKRALLEEFRTYVLPNISTPQGLIADVLEPYAEALAILKYADYQATTDAEKINKLICWLNRIDNSDWLPPAMLFLARNKDNPQYVLWFFERLERLAAYMHISAHNVNDRIERYAKLINALEAPHDMDNPVQAVELNNAEKMLMQAALKGDIYTLTARRRNYLILRLDSFVADGAASYDPSILTIEHVLPQTVSQGSEWEELWPDPELRATWVHKLANLVPLNKRRNSQAQNYDFETKKTAYFKGRNNVSSYALTSQVLHEDKWMPEVLQARQQELLNVLYSNWRLQ